MERPDSPQPWSAQVVDPHDTQEPSDIDDRRLDWLFVVGTGDNAQAHHIDPRLAIISPFLRALVYGHRKTEPLLLPELDPDSFEYYLHWLIAGYIPFPLQDADSETDPDGDAAEKAGSRASAASEWLVKPARKEPKSLSWIECYPLLVAHVFGFQIGDAAFMDYLINQLERWLLPVQPPEIPILGWLIEQSEGDDKLQEFVIDHMLGAEGAEKEIFHIFVKCAEERFERGEVEALGPSGCKYHAHGEGQCHTRPISMQGQPEPLGDLDQSFDQLSLQHAEDQVTEGGSSDESNSDGKGDLYHNYKRDSYEPSASTPVQTTPVKPSMFAHLKPPQKFTTPLSQEHEEDGYDNESDRGSEDMYHAGLRETGRKHENRRSLVSLRSILRQSRITPPPTIYRARAVLAPRPQVESFQQDYDIPPPTHESHQKSGRFQLPRALPCIEMLKKMRRSRKEATRADTRPAHPEPWNPRTFGLNSPAKSVARKSRQPSPVQQPFPGYNAPELLRQPLPQSQKPLPARPVSEATEYSSLGYSDNDSHLTPKKLLHSYEQMPHRPSLKNRASIMPESPLWRNFSNSSSDSSDRSMLAMAQVLNRKPVLKTSPKRQSSRGDISTASSALSFAEPIEPPRASSNVIQDSRRLTGFSRISQFTMPGNTRYSQMTMPDTTDAETHELWPSDLAVLRRPVMPIAAELEAEDLLVLNVKSLFEEREAAASVPSSIATRHSSKNPVANEQEIGRAVATSQQHEHTLAASIAEVQEAQEPVAAVSRLDEPEDYPTLPVSGYRVTYPGTQGNTEDDVGREGTHPRAHSSLW